MTKNYEKSDFFSGSPEPDRQGRSPFPQSSKGGLSPETQRKHIKQEQTRATAEFDEAIKTLSIEQLGQVRKDLTTIYDRFYRPREASLKPVGKNRIGRFLRKYNRLLDKAFEDDFKLAVVSAAREMDGGQLGTNWEDADLKSLHLSEMYQRLAARESVYLENVDLVIKNEQEFHQFMQDRQKLLEAGTAPSLTRGELSQRWNDAARFVENYFAGSGKELSKRPAEASLMTFKRQLDSLIDLEDNLSGHVDAQITELTDFLIDRRAYTKSIPEQWRIKQILEAFRNQTISWQVVLEKMVLDEEQNPRIPPSIRRDTKRRLLEIDYWVRADNRRSPQTNRRAA